MNPGQGNLGYNQMQPGQAGNTMDLRGNGQSNAGPGQGNRSQGLDRGNMTAFGNHTWIAPDDGNLTAPPEKPDRDSDNATALNKTGHHGPWGGNMTKANMTEIPPHMDRDPANMTAVNQTGHGTVGDLAAETLPGVSHCPAHPVDRAPGDKALEPGDFRTGFLTAQAEVRQGK